MQNGVWSAMRSRLNQLTQPATAMDGLVWTLLLFPPTMLACSVKAAVPLVARPTEACKLAALSRFQNGGSSSPLQGN